MKTPREIYARYRIMPNLQLHQLRVAAVGKIICDDFREPVNTHDVVLACLFHDIGNIIKFDLRKFPEFTKPEGIEYWESVKAEYYAKYGDDEHEATNKIAAEISLPHSVRKLIASIRFSKLVEILADMSYERKIVEYGDCRVSPHGITSVRKRFAEGRKRYVDRHASSAEAEAHYNKLTNAGYQIEQQIFEQASIRPEDITDASVAPVIEKLWDYPVS